ncbi:hypothetical protein [Spirochaeta africana]|uniref:Uncharacterized protein n=1 Tax=Spirochaeta africana (strain ATCC 700263 / DSM 8902 / Z-7692) TaxID=889378 RepID=H9UKS4_SPIAZ|nr:hypothetical protein [Spirochaeta africana]AFG38117.1 hypothetical protein Spiaf_2069 [Spirochaeta africana DSM 8902]
MSDWRDTLALILAAFWVMVPILLAVILAVTAGYGLFLLVFRVIF